MKVEASGYDKIYCYGGTHVLKNKLYIKNQDELQVAERQLTAVRLAHLGAHPVTGNLDYQHLCRIHKSVFQDLYDWAGKERTVDIAKANMFCKTIFLKDMASDIFSKYAGENYLLGSSKREVCERLAFYLGEINALHPFREGNGRSQREFIRCAAAVAGYEVNWSNTTPEKMLDASIASFDLRYSEMTELLEECTRPMSLREQLNAMEKIADKKGPLGKACSNYFKNINRIQKELKKIGYYPDDKTIRGVERLEKLTGRNLQGKEIHNFQPASREEAGAWEGLKKSVRMIDVLER